jgi:hypothetical protein
MADDGCESNIHRVFVTSQPVTADMNGMLGGALGGDAVCSAAATAASLSGTWMAWLSDGTTSPAMRFKKDGGPYVLLDGTPIAPVWPALIQGFLMHPIDRDETGITGLTVDVWTGTGPDGLYANPPGGPLLMPVTNCLGWTTKVSDVDACVIGHSADTMPTWTLVPPLMYPNCISGVTHLYCFEQ